LEDTVQDNAPYNEQIIEECLNIEYPGILTVEFIDINIHLLFKLSNKYSFLFSSPPF